eukprot:6031902-Alexandrium_andersonii.AAC.1
MAADRLESCCFAECDCQVVRRPANSEIPGFCSSAKLREGWRVAAGAPGGATPHSRRPTRR